MVPKRNGFIVIFFLIFTVFYISFDWIRFDISVMTDNIGFKLALGIIIISLAVIYGIILLVSVVLFFKNHKTDMVRAIMPAISCLVVLLYFVIINNSEIYTKINYKIQYNSRIAALQGYEEGILQKINVDKYIVPHRLSSHNKIVYIQDKGGVVKAMFFVSNGFGKDRILVYVSDDSGIDMTDFNSGAIPLDNLNFSNIQRLDENWYSATIKN